jgi:hypothetical protein
VVDGHKRRLPAVLGALAVSILLGVAAGPAAGAHTLVVSQTRD